MVWGIELPPSSSDGVALHFFPPPHDCSSESSSQPDRYPPSNRGRRTLQAHWTSLPPLRATMALCRPGSVGERYVQAACCRPRAIRFRSVSTNASPIIVRPTVPGSGVLVVSASVTVPLSAVPRLQ